MKTERERETEWVLMAYKTTCKLFYLVFEWPWKFVSSFPSYFSLDTMRRFCSSQNCYLTSHKKVSYFPLCQFSTYVTSPCIQIKILSLHPSAVSLINSNGSSCFKVFSFTEHLWHPLLRCCLIYQLFLYESSSGKGQCCSALPYSHHINIRDHGGRLSEIFEKLIRRLLCVSLHYEMVV